MLQNVKTKLYQRSGHLYACHVDLSPQVKDILKPEVMEEIVMMTQQKLVEHEG